MLVLLCSYQQKLMNVKLVMQIVMKMQIVRILLVHFHVHVKVAILVME